MVKNQSANAEDKKCRFNSSVGKIPWRRVWQPTPIFLPGESHGQRSLADYRPLGCKKLDMTEVTYQQQCIHPWENGDGNERRTIKEGEVTGFAHWPGIGRGHAMESDRHEWKHRFHH